MNDIGICDIFQPEKPLTGNFKNSFDAMACFYTPAEATPMVTVEYDAGLISAMAKGIGIDIATGATTGAVTPVATFIVGVFAFITNLATGTI